MTSPSCPVLDKCGVDLGVRDDSSTDSTYNEDPPSRRKRKMKLVKVY